MIPEQHASWAHFLFRQWLKHFLLKDFHAIYLVGQLPDLPARAPVILTPNHSSWYDGFIPYWLNDQYLKRTFHILMLEDQLRKYWFFQKLGAIGMKQDSPQDIRKTLSHLNSRLQPNNLLVFFPQGKITPELPGPYQLADGLRFLSHHPETLILPALFRIESLNERKPSLFITFDTPLKHTDYTHNPERLQTAFQVMRTSMNTALQQESFGKLIYGNPIKPL